MTQKGFFTKSVEIQQALPLQIHNSTYRPLCGTCGLDKRGSVGIIGRGVKNILIISECMSKGIEQVFRDKLLQNGLDLDADFYRVFVVSCPTPNNRQPTKKELKCCKPIIDAAIKKVAPTFIWLVGALAVESFYMGRFKNLAIETWRHRCIPDRVTGAWVVPLYSPAAIYKQKNYDNRIVETVDENTEVIFDKDLEWAVACLDREKYKATNVFDNIEVLTDFESVVNLLREIERDNLRIAFDYETTAISPYHTRAMIWTIGVAIADDKAYSFPYDYNHWSQAQREQIKKLWIAILQKSSCEKIAQNLKFEEIWSYKIFGVAVNGWLWDTMIASHIIETQNMGSGLKYQTYVRWGVEPYDGAIEAYMKGSANSDINNLGNAPLYDLCLYNGADALFTYMLYLEQVAETKKESDLYRACRFFYTGLATYSDLQKAGICVDAEYYKSEEQRLTLKIEKIQEELMVSEENKRFNEKLGRDVNIRSNKDLSILLFDVLGLTSNKKTNSGGFSTDKESLAEIASPYCKKLLKLRVLMKIRDTYLAQYKRCAYRGQLHPFFDLHTTRTYRSSSSFPNFQNVPVRDITAKNIIRGGIIPSRGNKLAEWDYSSIEVRIAACYTRDPVLIDYLNNPESDMHRDQTMALFAFDDKQITHELRSEIKSRFVFPEFYGSYYKSCAKDIYNNCFKINTGEGISLRKHLKNKGIIGSKKTEYKDFENHMFKFENKFWNKFEVFRAWQEGIVAFYKKHGYVTTKFGHRRGGVLNHNQIINTPFQATASHCLLWSLTQLNRLRKTENWKTKIIGQIHDSGVYDVVPDEEEYVLAKTYGVACNRIRNRFSWLVVPLDIEIDITDIDGAWSTKKTFDFKENNIYLKNV